MTHPREFFGLPMQQNEYAPAAINRVLIELRPARIVEIGSGACGLTMLLLEYAARTGGYVLACEVNGLVVPEGYNDDLIRAEFSCWDVESRIERFISFPGPTLVLCDGGDKPREFRTFAAYLKPGDVIAAHDYPSPNWSCVEITDEDVDPVCEEHGLVPFCDEEMVRAAWVCRRKR